MKYEFGVAKQYHMAGADVDHLGDERFPDYATAKLYADQEDECQPTIYIIIDNKYAFYCEPYASCVKLRKGDVVPYVYSIQSTPWGQIEVRIWWNKLIENPQSFYRLAVGKVGG